MEKQLMITVETPHPTQSCKYQNLLRNSIALDDSLRYDYQGLIRGLELLYPNKKIIIHLTLI